MAVTITTLQKEVRNGIEYGSIKVHYLTADVVGGSNTIILPAPGAGKVLLLTEIPVIKLTVVTTPFTTANNAIVKYENDTEFYYLYNYLINYAFSKTKLMLPTTTDELSNMENQRIAISIPSATGGGTSTLDFYISYKIINL